jgi:hypothetical protein
MRSGKPSDQSPDRVVVHLPSVAVRERNAICGGVASSGGPRSALAADRGHALGSGHPAVWVATVLLAGAAPGALGAACVVAAAVAATGAMLAAWLIPAQPPRAGDEADELERALRR